MKITLAVPRFLVTVLLLALVATSCGAADEAGTSAATFSVESDSGSDSGSRDSGDDTRGDVSGDAIGGVSSGVWALDLGGTADGDYADSDDASDASSYAFRSEADSSEESFETELEDAPEPRPRPQAGLLTAGDLDDNLNYGFFGTWISQVQQRQANVPRANLADRIRIEVLDGNVVGVGNVPLTVSDGDDTVTLFTSTGGVAWLYPHHVGLSPDGPLTVQVRHHDGSVIAESTIDSNELESDDRSVTIPVDVRNQLPDALDVALVLDVTGSMTDELSYLTAELQAIIQSVQIEYSGVDVRVGLIVYRDVGDAFVTRVFDFADVETIHAQLAEQRADGGGDFPEAMHTALAASLDELSWRSGNVARMLLLNADAPPHSGFLDATVERGRRLTEQGVRIYSLAASGVDETAEFTMRVLAATSGGRHLFLTDDSGIGNSHAEPKAECYQVTALNDLLRRVIASELAGERIEANDAAIIRTVGAVDQGRCVSA